MKNLFMYLIVKTIVDSFFVTCVIPSNFTFLNFLYSYKHPQSTNTIHIDCV